MTGLTPAQKRLLHTAPCCGHLIASHDGAGCLTCLHADPVSDGCRETPATVETTYEAAAALVTAARGEVVRSVAGRWQVGGWSHVLLPKPPRSAPPVIAYANRVTDWLRAEADRIERGEP